MPELDNGQPLILALDLATTAGWTRGVPGGDPTFGSIAFARGDDSDAEVFGRALRWLSTLLEPQPRPDMLVLEALLPAAAKITTNKLTRDRLAGLRGAILGVADCRGIRRIHEIAVGDVRAHFIGTRGMKRNVAKREVMRACRRLGWNVEDDHAGDACALWSYACSMIEPKLALRVSPLFQKGVAL
jgi:hypothetical protein